MSTGVTIHLHPYHSCGRVDSEDMLAVIPAAAADRNTLIEEHLDYANMLAHKLASRLPPSVDLDDLMSDAYLGLIHAAAAFRVDHGAAFRTYAYQRINGAMLDGLRSRQQLRKSRGIRMQSLDTVLYTDDGQRQTLGEQLPANNPPVGTEMELLDEARFAMRHWDARYRRTLRETHLKGLNQKEIARKLGISASAVSQRMKIIRGMMLSSRERSTNRG